MHTQTKVLDYYTPLLLLCPMHVLTQMESVCTKNLIGTHQLDFLDNCQCRLNFLDNIMHIEARAQVPIFDDTQIGATLISYREKNSFNFEIWTVHVGLIGLN